MANLLTIYKIITSPCRQDEKMFNFTSIDNRIINIIILINIRGEERGASYVHVYGAGSLPPNSFERLVNELILI